MAATSVDQLCAAAGVTGPLFASADYHKRADPLDRFYGYIDFRAALERHPPRLPVAAGSPAIHTQTVLQGGFVLSKAQGDRAPLLEALAHLKAYLTLLFRKETVQ